jgi:hypothetical protein
LPVAGNPLRTTFPVEVAQVGFVIVPITGAVGESGCGLITTSADCTEVQAASLVTVKLKVPAGIPVTVVVVFVPVVISLSGSLVRVQVPVDGKPLRTTLPVPTEHVRFVIVPTVGAEGMKFTSRMYVTTAAEHGDPRGLLEVTVIVINLPRSELAGV